MRYLERACAVFGLGLALASCGGADPADAGDSSSDGASSGSGSASTTAAPSSTAAPDDGSSTAAASTTTATDGIASSDEGAGTTTSGGTTTGEPGLPRDAVAVAVGYGTRRARSEDGLAWTDFQEVNPNGGDDDDLLRGIGYGGGVFLAVGGAGDGFSMRSLDGITWQDENHDPGSFVSDVAWQDGIFVAAGGNGLRMRSLDEGVSWQDDAGYYAGHYRAIAAGGGVVVAIGHTYGDTNVGLVSTTVDGVTWTAEQTGGAPYSGGSLAYGGGAFVARNDAGEVRVSSDGAAWGDPVLELGDRGTVVFADGEHITAGDGAYWTSPDGGQWTEVPSPDARDLAGWIDGRHLALGWPATIAASEDLATWEIVFDPGGSGLTDIAFGVPG